MNQAGRIISINPPRAIPGGEVVIECEGFKTGYDTDYAVFFGSSPARLVAASAERVIAVVPEDFVSGETEVFLESDGERSEPAKILVAETVARDLHIVANPAVDPEDDSIILTRSGSRGQQLPVTLFRLDRNGILDELSGDVLNPTGLAFDRDGKLFVTNRAEGEVVQVLKNGDVVSYASNLGVATGIAFNSNGEMFVGDRGGTIYKVSDLGDAAIFATLESSVAAYHMAFDADDNLYVTAPSLSSFDSVKKIDREGYVEDFYRGLGRPQGLAFDREGNLYVAACLRSRRGIVRITPDGRNAEIFVAGSNVIGLCFTRKGEMIIATNEAVFSLPLGIKGTLLS
jgi:Gluconolactonase